MGWREGLVDHRWIGNRASLNEAVAFRLELDLLLCQRGALVAVRADLVGENLRANGDGLRVGGIDLQRLKLIVQRGDLLIEFGDLVDCHTDPVVERGALRGWADRKPCLDQVVGESVHDRCRSLGIQVLVRELKHT